MRLSKLHIAGFKSFPDRAELGFDHGVTAIVGPNGCGKSNVVDAITWVLGEQSAKSLRGERMEDVIFNGSEARKPTAAAEVRLKFRQVPKGGGLDAEPDGDPLLDVQPIITRDVEIGRRLYRSGESEYLIDGEVCRLRDIHDLLMDSGLGVKAYAVIEQGKIGQILSSRPAERRMLIEEAAGVTKYKSRRRTAELKLEAAQHNLTRVDDIIFEVEKQRGALKRQAARARRYKRLREQLRVWEQVQCADRYEALRREIAAADARLEAARVREVAAAASVAELESALEALRIAVTEAEATATATREQAHARELSIGRRQQQIQSEGQQIQELVQQSEAFSAEAAVLEGRREPAAGAIQAQRDAAVRARAALDDAAHRVADRETDYARALAGVQAIEQEADAARAVVLSASTTLSALCQARDHAGAVRDRVAAERERLEIETRELEAEAARAGVVHDDATRALAEARVALDATRADRTAAEAAAAADRIEREQQVQALATRERELAGLDARLRSLEELESRRASFGDAARLLLADGNQVVTPHGALADHLEVERSYERAVDALVGDRLQHVLVDTVADVEAALGMLAERKAGRCGFLVLENAPRNGDAAASAVTAPPGVRSLQSVVRATGPHAAALSRAIGDGLIVESLAAARALASTVAVPVATIDGDVCRGGWLIEGGSYREVRGILETRAEMLRLRDAVATAGGDVQTLTAGLAELDQRVAAGQARVADLLAAQHGHEKSIVALDGQANRAADERQRVRRRLDVVGTDRARADEEHATTERRRDEAIAAIGTHEDRMREAQQSLSAILGRLQAARDGAEGSMRLVTEVRTEQATLTERVAAADADVARLQAAWTELEERIEGRRAEVTRIQGRCGDLRASIAEAERALDEDVRQLEALTVSLRAVDERVAASRHEFGERDQAIRAARHVLDEARADVMQSEVAHATATSDLTHLGETCLDAFGASLDDVERAVARMREAGELNAPAVRSATPGDDEDETADETDARDAGEGEAMTPAGETASGEASPDDVMALLREKIDRLGPVNMMAIEQFDELESRHTFLTTQRKDLLDSIAQTGEAISKIDKTTRERFAEAFAVINEHFAQTFTTLFGGGRAGLVLIDQENEEESGIDIIAQPPGKRLQNVQLLSGGEKALTAMALMFAIFKHRPSPFCLLDEIDAPLDDANIGRFVEMLQGMGEHTQFILITHNRKTMEIADRLYGVTMEEPGVSKLISLQIN